MTGKIDKSPSIKDTNIEKDLSDNDEQPVNSNIISVEEAAAKPTEVEERVPNKEHSQEISGASGENVAEP
jgi:hypothetical protein